MITSKTLCDDALVLASHLTTAVTTTTTDTGVELKPRNYQNVKALVNVTSLDTTTGDETYTISIKVSDVVGGTYTSVGSLTVTAVGLYEIPLSGTSISNLDADSDFVQCVATLGGTTPILKYETYLSVN